MFKPQPLQPTYKEVGPTMPDEVYSVGTPDRDLSPRVEKRVTFNEFVSVISFSQDPGIQNSVTTCSIRPGE